MAEAPPIALESLPHPYLWEMFIAMKKAAPTGLLQMCVTNEATDLIITFHNTVDCGQYGELHQQVVISYTHDVLVRYGGDQKAQAIAVAHWHGMKLTDDFDARLRQARGEKGEYYGRRA